ncbi:MAG: DUF333 domain-containing protein [Oligoflexia bacterium]|nr:DUF333 domain-containing protein [Oligoflexia bacterium]
MNLLIGLLITTLSAPAFAAPPASALGTSFERYAGGRFVPQAITEHQGLRVNPECAQTPTTCQALKTHARALQSRIKRDIAAHPADAFCVKVGGSVVLLRDAEKDQRNFCEFPDGSLIDSWQLHDAGKEAP